MRGVVRRLGSNATLLSVVSLVVGFVALVVVSLRGASMRVTLGTVAVCVTLCLRTMHLEPVDDRWATSLATPEWVAEAVSVAVVCVSVGLSLTVFIAQMWSLLTHQSTSFVHLIENWDAGWYASIVRSGYDHHAIRSGRLAGQANWAFFPLYPLAVWCVATALGLSPFAAGTLTSLLCLTVGCTFAYRYLLETRSRRVALLGVGLLAVGPYSFYNYTLYTESLFICLTAVGFWALQSRRYLVAAVAGALLSATRGVGVLFGVAMVAHLVVETDAFDAVRNDWPPGVRSDTARAAWETLTDRRVIAVALIPLGTLAYMTYLWWHIGRPLAFLTVQSAWGRSFQNPVVRLVGGLLSTNVWDTFLAATGTLALGVAVDLIRRGRPVEGTFALALLLVPIASGLNSLPRYAFGTTVLVFAAADWLSRSELSRTVGFGALTAANVGLLMLWYGGHHIVNYSRI